MVQAVVELIRQDERCVCAVFCWCVVTLRAGCLTCVPVSPRLRCSQLALWSDVALEVVMRFQEGGVADADSLRMASVMVWAAIIDVQLHRCVTDRT